MAAFATVRDDLLMESQWRRFSVARALCESLAPVPHARRRHSVQELLNHAIAADPEAPLLVDEIDLLFEPALQLDPRATLRRASQQKPLVG